MINEKHIKSLEARHEKTYDLACEMRKKVTKPGNSPKMIKMYEDEYARLFDVVERIENKTLVYGKRLGINTRFG